MRSTLFEHRGGGEGMWDITRENSRKIAKTQRGTLSSNFAKIFFETRTECQNSSLMQGKHLFNFAEKA
jgi:hypothetical protein